MRYLFAFLLIIARGTIFFIPFLYIIYTSGQYNPPPAFGILFWLIAIVFGAPWNSFILLVAGDLETKYAPGFFSSINHNHESVVGLAMTVAGVSVYINCLIASCSINLVKKYKNKKTA